MSAPRQSYSQFGEDILIEAYLEKRKGLRYIDIGCLWPVQHSNTYRFYQAGGGGLCIDPNPDMARLFADQRPRDVFVNAGVSSRDGEMTYSMFENPVFNTFETARRDRLIAQDRPGRRMVGETIVPVRRLDTILAENGWWSQGAETDVLCIDVEGHEQDVLESAALERLKPRLIVFELIGRIDTILLDPLVGYVAGFGYRVAGLTGHDCFMMRA
jgi:FkbM family methyltransferase